MPELGIFDPTSGFASVISSDLGLSPFMPRNATFSESVRGVGEEEAACHSLSWPDVNLLQKFDGFLDTGFRQMGYLSPFFPRLSSFYPSETAPSRFSRHYTSQLSVESSHMVGRCSPAAGLFFSHGPRINTDLRGPSLDTGRDIVLTIQRSPGASPFASARHYLGFHPYTTSVEMLKKGRV